MSENEKNVLDVAAAGIAAGTITEILPSIVAVLAIVWYTIRIYDWWRGNKSDG